MKRLLTIGLTLCIFASLPFSVGIARAEDQPVQPTMPMMMGGHGPYGGYCQGPGWGRYGARQQIRTAQDARAYLTKFFEDQDVVIGSITERGRFFAADILDKDKNIVDRVIIDKRTGRIRSLY
jgi:hypothetical protein